MNCTFLTASYACWSTECCVLVGILVEPEPVAKSLFQCVHLSFLEGRFSWLDSLMWTRTHWFGIFHYWRFEFLCYRHWWPDSRLLIRRLRNVPPDWYVLRCRILGLLLVNSVFRPSLLFFSLAQIGLHFGKTVITTLQWLISHKGCLWFQWFYFVFLSCSYLRLCKPRLNSVMLDERLGNVAFLLKHSPLNDNLRLD